MVVAVVEEQVAPVSRAAMRVIWSVRVKSKMPVLSAILSGRTDLAMATTLRWVNQRHRPHTAPT